MNRVSIAIALPFLGLACSDGPGTGTTEPTPTAGNSAPQITSPATVVAEEQYWFSYVPAATDPDGDPVSFRYAPLPAWLTVLGDTVGGRPEIGQAADAFTVIASDGTLEHSLDVTVEIRMPDNYPPIVTSSVSAQAEELLPFRYVATATDADGEVPEITFAGVPFWAAVSGDTLSGTPPRGVPSAIFKVLVSDGVVLDSSFIRVNVRSLNGEIQCNQDFGDPAQSPYVLPYAVGTTKTVIQGYCPSNPTWGHHNWFAYDFEMDIGETVIASRAGTVILTQEAFVDATRVCGEENYVFILHDDGTVMAYYHLTNNGALVDVGDAVQQGDAIGLSGDTGCSIGPHLHVALFQNRNNFGRQNGLPVNYSNATGPLDANRGLVFQSSYTAEVF